MRLSYFVKLTNSAANRLLSYGEISISAKYIILNNHEQMLVIGSDGSVKVRKQHLEPVKKFTAVALKLIKESYTDDPNVQMIPD